jgi:hypothetical protein
MTKFVTIAGIAGILAVASGTADYAQCAAPLDDAVREGAAVVTELSQNASATTYWLSAPDGWHVVTTVETVTGQGGDTEDHAVVRFSVVLLPGQSQLISVPLALGKEQQMLRIRRLNDRIEVARVPASSL